MLRDLQDFERATEPEEHRQTEREVEDLVVGEVAAEPGEELVVDGVVVESEPFGVLDRQTLAFRVLGRGTLVVERSIHLLGDASFDD